jgi:putative redox protein
MAVSVGIRRVEGLKFNVDVAGRTLELNSAEEMGKAFTPMELFLVSLGGCTAMDVQYVMDRQRQKVGNLEISVQGKRRENDPKYYETIDLEYSLEGQNIKKEAVEKAIRLSQDEYCSVKAMVKDNVRINVAYRIKNVGIPEQRYVYSSGARS